MANVPNIPSVVVTIEDRSYLQPILQSGRTMLFPFFSKYGTEEFQTWSSWEEFENKFGRSDPKKYGACQQYIKGAAQFTQSFLGKRLVPGDATFANNAAQFSDTGITTTSFAGQTDENGLVAAAETLDSNIMFYGSGRGDGYNDIVLKFSPLVEYEKFYADEDGIERYKFNILSASIYERQPNGALVQLENKTVPFALVDEDPRTNVAIKDIYDNQTLDIAERFESMSTHVRGAVADSNDDLANMLGIDDLGSPLIYDSVKGKTLFLTFEDGEIVPNYVSRSRENAVEAVRFHWVDNSGTDRYVLLMVVQGDVVLQDDTANGPQSDDVESIKIFSDNAFYTMWFSENGNWFAEDPLQEYETTTIEGQVRITTGFDNTGAAVIVNDRVYKEGDEYVLETPGNSTIPENIVFNEPLKYGDKVRVIQADDSTNNKPAVKLEPIFFARYNLWRYLISNEFTLTNGSTGVNLIINGRLNFDGPGATGTENAKMLLVDFYMNNSIIREVLYPQYDFDYVVDFTNDPDVQAAIVNLNDYLQTAFGIHSCGVNYDYTQDLNYRRYNLGISSFNNALYSGQANMKHYDADMGRTITMPSNYYAMLAHLYIDGAYSISEPVANVNKGALRTGSIKLSYTPSSTEIEKLRIRQINAIIDEPDGIYFIDQLTMYKRASILSRIHAIKPIQKVKKDLRRILKDVLQSKNGYAAVTRVETMISEYMGQWIYSPENTQGAFEYYDMVVDFDENTLTINVMLTVKPVRSVEKVSVSIIVV